MGKAGAIPAATVNDQADFLLILPFAMTLRRLKATAKTAPTSNTTIQVRRSTDSGGSFVNYFGTVTINATTKVGIADPVDASVNEGDILNFSITVGGGSGADLLVQVIGTRA